MPVDAPRWLTAAFAEGVPSLAAIDRPRPAPPYKGALGRCWLAQHDERRKPCKGRLERFHFLRRGTVEDVLARQLVACGLCDHGLIEIPEGRATCPACQGCGIPGRLRADLIALAAWDPRNADVACEGHHRRYDSHLTPPLPIGYHQVPDRLCEFAFDWGMEDPFEEKIGVRLIGLDEPQPLPDHG